MYSDKFINKNVHVERSRYITIGDPYQSTKDTLPPRWKEKQFHVPQIPMNSGEGYFGHQGKSFVYQSDTYAEQKNYLKMYPPDKRKNGFGTKNAPRRDEFSSTICTEQYRDTLRKEQRLIDMHHDPEAAQAVLEKARSNKKEKYVEGSKEIAFLYDVGRNLHTEFDPKNNREQFYSMKHGFKYDKRMGQWRTASQEVGDNIWQAKMQKPEFSAASQVKNFYDKSHLQVSGF